MNMALQARAGRCQEASPLSNEQYIPCNRPAVSLIHWPARSDEAPIRVCDRCEYHNVRDRGAELLGPYEAEADVEVKQEQQPQAAYPANDPAPADYSAYVEDARPTQAEAGNILSQITNTVRELRDAQEDVKRAEEVLKAAQEQEKRLREVALPLLMDEAQQKKLVTLDGWEVSRSEAVRASISADNMPRAVEWLNANGQGSIVKREVSLKFGKGEEGEAERAAGLLHEARFAPTDKYSVHPQTLGALVRELMEEGRDLPHDILGVYVQPLVKIKFVG